MAATKTGKQASSTKDTAADDAATEDGSDLYALSELVTRAGKATLEEVGDYVEGYTKAELIKEGAKVGTDRIDTDCARLYGKAADFFEHATPAQRAEVVGVSPNMLRVAVTAAQHGSEVAAKLGAAKNDADTAKQERAARAETARDRALGQRKVLRAGLRSLAAGNKIWHAAIDTAVKTSDAASTLSGSLDALIGVGRRMLKRPTPGLAKRLEDSGLTAARLTTAATQADEVRTAGGAADAVASLGPVSQSEVDYWDGINLTLLGSFIDVFEAAHSVDPTIPRLVPIALRNYYRPTRKAPGPPPDGGGTPPPA
jgi:hypothetical protein